MLMPATTAAAAGPPGGSGVVTRTDVSEFTGLFIGTDGYIVATGPPFESGCVGAGFQETTLVEVLRGNDSVKVGLRTDDDGLAVYAGDDFFTDVLIPSCEAIFDGDPLTEPVEPIAVGTADAGGREMISVGGASEGHFWIIGSAVDAEGNRLRIQARALVSVDDDGVLADERTTIRITPLGG